jgi:hypothetical protein
VPLLTLGITVPTRSFPLLLLGLCLLACGAEKGLTGVWQQVCDDTAQSPCVNEALEVHLGRYGDSVTGVVVRHLFEDANLDPYQRSQECGCWFIQGGRVRVERVAFTLYQPGEPGVPDEAYQPDPECAEAATRLPPACPEALYTLRLVEGDLVGELRCGATRRPMHLRRTNGRPRRNCLPAPSQST